MANEISLGLSLGCTKGNYSRQITENVTPTQNAQGAVQGIAATTTVKSNLDIGSVVTLGYLYAKNLDGSNNCDIGLDNSGTFVAFGTLKPGEVSCFRVKAGITIQLKAQAGTPPIEYWLLND